MVSVTNTLLWSVFWLSSALLMGAVWRADPLPLMDMVEWGWQGYAGAQLASGALETPDFAFKTWPVPNAIVPAILTLFGMIGLPFVGAKILASLFLIGASALSFGTARASLASQGGAAALCFVALVGTAFFNGYLNFSFGVLGLAWVTRGLISGRTPSSVAIALIAIALFFTHAIALATFSIVVFSFAVFGPLPKTRLIALVPAYLLFAWYLAMDGAGAGGTTFPALNINELIRFAAYKGYTIAKTGPYHHLFLDGLSQLDRAPILFYLGAAANGLWTLCLAAIALILVVAMRQPAHRALVASILMMLVIFLILPQAIGKVVNPGERFLMMAVALLAVCGFELIPPKIRTALSLLTTVYLIGAVGLFIFAVQPRAIPSNFEEPAAQSLAAFFVHYPNRSAYRYDQFTSGIAPNDIRFRTGILD